MRPWPRRLRCTSRAGTFIRPCCGHRGRDLVRAHQPVRIPARARRRSVRGLARRKGRRRCSGQARGRPARLRSRPVEPCLLRAAACCRCRGTSRLAQRATCTGATGGGGALTRWNFYKLGHIDHRKVVVVDGRVGWVGGAGFEDHFEDGRFHDLFLRMTGPVVSQLQLVFVASFLWLGGAISVQELDSLFPEHEAEVDAGTRQGLAQRAGWAPADHDCDSRPP